jgi:hypothetical protein
MTVSSLYPPERIEEGGVPQAHGRRKRQLRDIAVTGRLSTDAEIEAFRS